MAKHTYDKNTAGFRTIRNLRGYDDSERGFPPSIVDDSEYEDINVLVARFKRGEIIKVGRPVSYDGDGSAEEMFEKASPLDADGADLADVGPIADAIKERQNARKEALAASKGAAPLPDAEKPQGGKPEAPAQGSSGK